LDPLDFYEFAKEIRSSTSSFPEAKKRTIVGRVYYAVFLMIRDELGQSLVNSPLKSVYDSLSQQGLIHSLVVDVLKTIETSSYLGNVLYGMHRRRRTADYRMQAAKNWDNEINDIVADAEEMLRNRSTMHTMFSQKGPEIDTVIASWSVHAAGGF
jgi:uncharacterized protein (UPF0332 family)